METMDVEKLSMHLLAEIADKMPTIPDLIGSAVVVAAVCVAVAFIHRIVAWSMLGIALFVGAGRAYSAFDWNFFSSDLRNEIWTELGWPWVIADIASPLLPAIGVAAVLLLRCPRKRSSGFPIEPLTKSHGQTT